MYDKLQSESKYIYYRLSIIKVNFRSFKGFYTIEGMFIILLLLTKFVRCSSSKGNKICPKRNGTPPLVQASTERQQTISIHDRRQSVSLFVSHSNWILQGSSLQLCNFRRHSRTEEEGPAFSRNHAKHFVDLFFEVLPHTHTPQS